jgi:hypothetical protein
MICAYCGKIKNKATALSYRDMCIECGNIRQAYTQEKTKCTFNGMLRPSSKLLKLQEHYIAHKRAGHKVPKEFREV